MKKSLCIALSINLITMSSSAFCSFLAPKITMRAFSVSKKDLIAQHILRTIAQIKRSEIIQGKSSSTEYMQLAQQAVHQGKFEQANNFIKAYYCNQMLEFFITEREKEEQQAQQEKTKILLQKQIKNRLKQKNFK